MAVDDHGAARVRSGYGFDGSDPEVCAAYILAVRKMVRLLEEVDLLDGGCAQGVLTSVVVSVCASTSDADAALLNLMSGFIAGVRAASLLHVAGNA